MMEYYAISYYGEHYKLGYIEMDFLDCDTVNRFVGESRNGFWEKVHIISAEVPYSTYKRNIGIKDKTLRSGGALFKVTLKETTRPRSGFACDIYSRDGFELRQSRVMFYSVERCSKEEEERIIKDLMKKFDLSDYPEYDGPDGDVATRLKSKLKKGPSPKSIIFRTYDVGQGLATSLTGEEVAPFMYFDYGTDKIANEVPPGLNMRVDAKKTVIFLSHVHEDHWCGYRINPEALKCTWIVPDQSGHSIYHKFLIMITLSHGSVYRHGADIDLGSIYIGHAASTINPTRVAAHEHESGFAMYINARVYDEFEDLFDYKITVAGDQDYDYQDATKYADTDLLVACHHGGKYCWSTKYTRIKPHDDNSVIVYSYGINNTFGHPSKTADYSGWGWKKRHDTATDGMYQKWIFI
ncbi:hypothetical protein D6853_05780 [Butyrivibrio sp. X503]|uniref:hypothetical protein n=1 Tax=Butyrivibrio sp. X503 TaxID=2364878 RepID=UPI000EAA6288|nr:hypothetical protein [Butyrivibrio sp. X503]RKM56304.1 hypothetical protein D6853_05780 [Butyrivibrio sp. X503]